MLLTKKLSKPKHERGDRNEYEAVRTERPQTLDVGASSSVDGSTYSLEQPDSVATAARVHVLGP